MKDTLILDALLLRRINMQTAAELRKRDDAFVRAFLADASERWSGNRVEMMRERGARKR